MGVNRIELVFRQRPVSPSELYRNIVKSARREAAIEMSHSRDDHSDDRNLNVGTRVVENEEIESRPLGKLHASSHLLARVQMSELRIETRWDSRIFAWRQIRIVLQAQWSGAVKAGFVRFRAS